MRSHSGHLMHRMCIKFASASRNWLQSVHVAMHHLENAAGQIIWHRERERESKSKNWRLSKRLEELRSFSHDCSPPPPMTDEKNVWGGFWSMAVLAREATLAFMYARMYMYECGCAPTLHGGLATKHRPYWLLEALKYAGLSSARLLCCICIYTRTHGYVCM